MATNEDVDSLFEPDVDDLFEPDAPVAAKPLTLAEGGGVLSGKPGPVAPAAKPESRFSLGKLADAAERAATNTLEGVTFGGAGAVVPYINAAVDELNPFSESKDFGDRVAEQRQQYNSKLDPVATAAATVAPSMLLGPVGLAADGALNTLMSARESDRQGKSLIDPNNAVDTAGTAALMTALPPAAGQAARSAGHTVDALKNAGFAKWLRETANSMASRAVGLNKSQLNQLPIDAPQTIGQVLNDKKIFSEGSKATDFTEPLRAAKREAGESMGDVLRTADSVTGGSGADIRAVSGSRKAADAHEMVKNRLLQDALASRIGSRVSQGRAGMEAATRTAGEANQTLNRNHLTEVLDLVGSAQDDASRAAGLRSDVAAATKNDLLFDAGKVEQRQLAQADAARNTVGEAEDFAKARMSPVAPTVRARAELAPNRVPDVDAIAPAPDALGSPTPLSAIPARARPEAAEALASSIAAEKVPVPEVADLARARAPGAPDVPTPREPNIPAVDLARPETFAAAGDRSKDLQRIHTDEVTQSVAREPADPRSFSEGLGFNAHQFVDRAEREILPALADPALAGLKAKTERLLSAYRNRANSGMSFSEGNKMKSVLQSTIRKFQDAKADQSVKLDLQRIIDDALEEQLASVVGDDAFRQFVKGKADYGALANASKANNQLIRKEAGNMPLGLMETVGTGAIGSMLGNTIGALPGAVGTAVGLAAPHAIRQTRVRGPATAARMLDRTARFIEDVAANAPTGDAAAGLSPALVKALGPDRIDQFKEWLNSLNDNGSQK